MSTTGKTDKHVYFFRHGESVANATKIRQGPETPLTLRGRYQAEELGKRLLGIPIERMVSSDFVRAHETAHIVTRWTRHGPITLSPLFVERRNPSFMMGHDQADESDERALEEIAANYGTLGWHHSYEENFEDLIVRVKEALSYILTLPEQCIAVASHGLFMKVVFAHVLLGECLDGRIFWDQFIPTKNVENTGIMHLHFTDNFQKTAKHWKLISWNDHAHLE